LTAAVLSVAVAVIVALVPCIALALTVVGEMVSGGGASAGDESSPPPPQPDSNDSANASFAGAARNEVKIEPRMTVS
jgi:hypothetical protein